MAVEHAAVIKAASSVWNSLEIAKLAVAVLTPIVVAAGGYWINGRLKSLEAAQWSQQKIVERRIQAYDQLAPFLNKILCFFYLRRRVERNVTT